MLFPRLFLCSLLPYGLAASLLAQDIRSARAQLQRRRISGACSPAAPQAVLLKDYSQPRRPFPICCCRTSRSNWRRRTWETRRASTR